METQRPKGQAATPEEKLAALKVCTRSAGESPDGLPNWTECERLTGWSRGALRNWWRDMGARQKRTPTAPATPSRPTVASRKGDVLHLPPPDKRSPAGARIEDEPEWSTLRDVEYFAWELARTHEVRELAKLDGDYAAWARLQTATTTLWRELHNAISKRASTSGRTAEQVRAELLVSAGRMPDALLEIFVLEWRKRYPGAA